MRAFLLASAVLVLGCSGALGEDDDDDGGDGQGASGPGLAGDLPCDLTQLLSQHCVSCHAGADAKGSVSLTSYADLIAKSPADGSVTVADRALIRMRDAAAPMPQAGLLPESDVAVLDAWIQSGMPQGDCQGAGGGTVTIACTSDQFWTSDEESPDMYPGRACVSCHDQPNAEGEKGPQLGFAGTVYPTLHEPDDCVSTDILGTSVVVTDADGVVREVDVRAGGNFFAKEVSVTFPIRAEIRRNGKTIAMQDPVMSGDCNACHTATGAEDAPGRLFAPE